MPSAHDELEELHKNIDSLREFRGKLNLDENLEVAFYSGDSKAN
jgi:hypothetical protein